MHKFGAKTEPNQPRPTYKVPGRGPAAMGRPNLKGVDRTQLFVTEEEDFIAKSDKCTKQITKKAYNFVKSINKNQTLLKRHTRQ